jgi:phosphatidylglycerol:prolipoprotein diacylglycerol transferase
LLKIGPLTLRTYGLFVALGFFAAMHYLLRRAKRYGIAENRILDLLLYSIVFGLLGARIAYVLFNWGFYATHPGDILRIWEGGLVFYGGFIVGAATVIAYTRLHRELKLWTLADLLAPAIALGHVFGRLGCLFAGCCYGQPTNFPWALRYCNPESLAPLNMPLHPTQLYEALGNLAIFVALDRYNGRRHAEGFAFAAYLALYALLRFLVEFLRGDDRGAFIWGLSPSQAGSIVAALIALFIFMLRRNKFAEAK